MIALIIGVAIVVLFLLDTILTPFISEQDWLEAIGFSWKTAAEIQQELNSRHCKGRKYIGALSERQVRQCLEHLKQRELIDTRTANISLKKRFLFRDHHREFRRKGKRVYEPIHPYHPSSLAAA